MTKTGQLEMLFNEWKQAQKNEPKESLKKQCSKVLK